MAKSMARIDGNGTVINKEWCSASQPETAALKDPGDRSVGIGDTYLDGRWYRDGAELLTRTEELEKRIAELEALNADQAAALTAIYEGGTEVSV